MNEIRFKRSPRQTLAISTLSSPDVDELLYGGAKGGGKTVLGCQWVVQRVSEIIDLCGLRPTPTPPIVGFMGRKQSVDFTSTTLNTWIRFIPGNIYTHLKQEKRIRLFGAADVQYGGMDDSETVKKFNSAEYAFYFIDQAEETEEQDIALIRGALRLKLNGIQPPYKGLLTANPAQSWIKRAFITAPQKGTKFVQALPSDNPFIDAKAYVEQLKKAFGFNPQLLSAYLYGSWDDLDTAFTVIPAKDINACVESGATDPRGIKRITVADIAENGEDETVIYDFEGPRVVPETAEIYAHRDLMDTVGRIMAHARKNRSSLVCVDKVGLGAGVYSRLQEVYSDSEGDDEEADGHIIVYGFDGRIEPPGDLNGMTFKNYKSYAWFQAAEAFRERQIDIPPDDVLKAQLSGVTWHFTNGEVIALDKNEDVREKLGQSPDRATTVIMGLDALKRAPYRKHFDAYQRKARPQRFNWATV